MSTADELPRAASSLPEAEERETWGHPTFRVTDTMFATLSDGSRSAGIKPTKAADRLHGQREPRHAAP